MDKVKLLEQLLPLEVGKAAYVEGEFHEIKSALASYECFVVSLWSHGQCKITKIKTKQESFYRGLAEQMANYIGTPFQIENDVQKIRMAVSRYNRLNKTSFSVRSVGDNRAEVYTDSLTDFKFISQDRFDGYVERMQEQIDELRKRVRSDQFFRDAEIMEVEYEDEQEDGSEPEPDAYDVWAVPDGIGHHVNGDRVEGTAVCTECGDEFFKQGSSSKCGDCLDDEGMI